MNRKDRAINLGLKINSLKGNFSVAKSVIKDLEVEIKEAVIDDADRESLLQLYTKIVQDLKSVVSPSTEERSKINQKVEDLLSGINKAKSYHEVEVLDGPITQLAEALKGNKILKKEHKAALLNRAETVREKYKSRVGFFLKRNHDQLKRKINLECDCDSPYHISVVVKKYNDIVKTTPLFADDRKDIQALLDTFWQRSSMDIKLMKKMETVDREYDD